MYNITNGTKEAIERQELFDLMRDQSDVLDIMDDKDNIFQESMDDWLEELETFTRSMDITETFQR